MVKLSSQRTGMDMFSCKQRYTVIMAMHCICSYGNTAAYGIVNGQSQLSNRTITCDGWHLNVLVSSLSHTECRIGGGHGGSPSGMKAFIPLRLIYCLCIIRTVCEIFIRLNDEDYKLKLECTSIFLNLPKCHALCSGWTLRESASELPLLLWSIFYRLELLPAK